VPNVDASPLPSDAVLLHIGPHKTGTSALQSAVQDAQAQLAKHGVHVAGARRGSYLGVLAVTGRPGRRGDPEPAQKHWQTLVDEVAANRNRRVFVSNERFSDAGDEAIERIVRELGGDRVHVVITIRALIRILPSQWQQHVRNGSRKAYEPWLRRVLRNSTDADAQNAFWVRHAHDRLAARWAKVVGADRVTVVVGDEADRTMLLRTFESLLGVPAETLQAGAQVNRSLSLAETEVIRRVNVHAAKAKWPGHVYRRLVGVGLVNAWRERSPEPGEHRITTPMWAQKRASDIGTSAAVALAASDVRVIGDLRRLSLPHNPAPVEEIGPAEDPWLPASAAALALIGAIDASAGTSWQNEQSVAATRRLTRENLPRLALAGRSRARVALVRAGRRFGLRR
jgi:hypothetical protein